MRALDRGHFYSCLSNVREVMIGEESPNQGGSDILMMQGSEWQEHVVDHPFEAESAYWIETTVPLCLRANGPA